jgi:hypothetical protein
MGGGAEGGVPGVKTELKASGENKETTKFRISDVPTEQRFRDNLTELMNGHEVLLDLELEGVDTTNIDELNGMLDKLHNKFNLVLPDGTTDPVKGAVAREAAKPTLERLRGAAGKALVHASFLVSNPDVNSVKLTVKHPVSRFLGEGSPVNIDIFLPAPPAGSPLLSGPFAPGRTVDLWIFGAARTSTNSPTKPEELAIPTLTIDPIAVF